MAWDDGLTEAQKIDVLRAYDERERARVRAEWEEADSFDHECDPFDTYVGGCSVCGGPVDEAKVRQ